MPSPHTYWNTIFSWLGGSIWYNLLHLWIMWCITPYQENVSNPPPPLRFMVRECTSFRGVRTVWYIGFRGSIFYHGGVMILWHGKLQSLLIGCRRWKNFINPNLERLACWRMFWEVLEPTGGIFNLSELTINKMVLKFECQQKLPDVGNIARHMNSVTMSQSGGKVV